MSQAFSLRARVVLCGLAVAAGIIGACADKASIVQPPPPPPPPTAGAMHIEGNRVVWQTDKPARGSVRYSFKFSNAVFDHMAYPDAANRLDRSFTNDHSVALLDLAPGHMTYYQVVSEAIGAATGYSAVDSFVATTAPTANLLVSTMIHIGFGDSHLLTMPSNGRHILIDGGTRPAEQSVKTYLRDHGVTQIHAMLATHTHEDHLGGEIGSNFSSTDGVAGAFPGAIFFDSEAKNARSQASSAYADLLRTLAGQSRIRVVLHRFDTASNVFELRWDGLVSIRVLNAGTPAGYVSTGDVGGTDINNESIVLLFTYGDVRFVMGGDSENESEASMLGAFPAADLEVNFAKLHHHGLPNATSVPWIQTLNPRVAFVPNTAYSWDPASTLAGAIAQSAGRAHSAGADVYVVDDAPSLGRPRDNTAYPELSKQYNTSFVTDGRSYEVRVELATQPAPAKVQESDCGPHGDAVRGLGGPANEPPASH